MIILTAVKCLCIISYSGNIPNYDIVAAVNCLCIIFYSGNIPNYDNCSCCKMPMYYIL